MGEALGSWRRPAGVCAVKCAHSGDSKSASRMSTVSQTLLWRTINIPVMFENTFTHLQEGMLACYRGITEKTRRKLTILFSDLRLSSSMNKAGSLGITCGPGTSLAVAALGCRAQAVSRGVTEHRDWHRQLNVGIFSFGKCRSFSQLFQFGFEQYEPS